MEYKPNKKKKINLNYQRYLAAENLRDDSIPECYLERPERIDELVLDSEDPFSEIRSFNREYGNIEDEDFDN